MRWPTLAFCTALFFTAVYLSSPARSDKFSAPGVVEISYMAPEGPIGPPMEEAVRVFERERLRAHDLDPKVPIVRIVSGQNASRDPTDDPTRFLISLAGGIPPDVIAFDRFAMGEWAARGAFCPLDAFLKSDLQAGTPDAVRQADYFPAAWNECVVRDPISAKASVYGVPFSIDDRVLFYNKDLLRGAGFTDGKGQARPPRTWEELREMSDTITEKDADGRILRAGFIPNFGNTWLYLFGWMNGGEFMSPDGRTCTLNEPRIVEALDWMTKAYDRLGGAEAVYAFQSTFQHGALDPFVSGKVAMKIDGVWTMDAMAQYATQLNWAAAAPPMPGAEAAKGRRTLSWVGGWCYAIPSGAQHKEAAWDFIRFLSTRRANRLMSESQALAARAQGRTYVPAQHPNIAFNDWQFRRYVYDDPAVDPKVRQAMHVFNDLLGASRFRPATVVGQELWNQQNESMEAAIFHKKTAQAALDEGAALVQKGLNEAMQAPHGGRIPWHILLWCYALLMLILAALCYRHDLRGEFAGARGARARGQWGPGWLMASPWLAGFLVFTGGPILFSILVSFCRYDVVNPAHLVGLGNYARMFAGDPLFWKSLGNTLFMVLGLPLGMALSLGIAMLLNMDVRGIAVWRTFFYLPSIVPAVASCVLWMWLLNPHSGLINVVLASTGIVGPNWLQNEHTSKVALVLMGLWACGSGMLVCLAGLKGISDAYYEAACLDGADELQQFWFITLPMMSPYLFFNLVIGLIGVFNIFTQAFVMTKGGPVNSTLFYVYHVFNSAFRMLDMGYAAALSWFLFLIIFSLTLLQLRLSKAWVYYEGD